MTNEIKEILEMLRKYGSTNDKVLLGYISNLQDENERLNDVIKNIDKMFEYYFLGNLKYDQETVNTIYIRYVKLKELQGE